MRGVPPASVRRRLRLIDGLRLLDDHGERRHVPICRKRHRHSEVRIQKSEREEYKGDERGTHRRALENGRRDRHESNAGDVWKPKRA